MKQTLSWAQKYELGLSEDLTISEIQELRNCGRGTASEIRKKCVDYCLENDIEFTGKRIPTEAVFAVTKKDLDFYYDKMIKESKCREVC